MSRPFRPALAVFLMTAASGCFAHAPAISGPDSRPLPGSVASLEKMELGGMEQWVLIKEETFVPQRRGPEPADGRADAEPAEPRTERVILPFLLYTPETKLGGGVVAAGYRRLQPDLPVSSLLGAVTVAVPLGSGSTVALRAYLEGSGGDAPVLLLPSLGGRKRLRGYCEGRLRDRVAGAAQGELRFPLWRRFGGVAFAEVGQVGPRLGDLASGRTELSAGAGLRFRLGEEAARIRADFAVGRRGSGLYLTIGEAF